MRIKISLWQMSVVFGALGFVGLNRASTDVPVVTLPAQIRMPEGLLVPSGDLVVRSNQEQEFTEFDADSSVVLHKIEHKNPVDDLVADGTIITMEQAESQSESVPKVEPEKPVAVDMSAFESSATAIEDFQIESQWIINPEQNECLSIDSQEAKAILAFVKKSCDDPAAVTKFSLSARDILVFLTMIKRYSFDPIVLDVGLRKFYNRLKGCMIIDDVVLHQLLPELASVLELNVDYEKNASMSIGMVQQDIEQLMCDCFLKYSHMLSDRVNDFVTKLSRVTARTAYQSLESDENPQARMRHDRERLRHLAIRILDLMLDRVAWAPHAFESIWPSFIKIGSFVHDFAQKNVITHMDDFKDLYTTLVNRFVFYINLHATVLPSDFFRVIQNDLGTGVVFFLEYPDHADLKKFLEDEINGTMLRSVAFERMELAQVP